MGKIIFFLNLFAALAVFPTDCISAGAGAGLSEADGLFEKQRFHEALPIYEKTAASSSGEAKLKALYRTIECLSLLDRRLEAEQKAFDIKLPDDPVWKARFLILRAKTGENYLQQYGFASPEDIEEGTQDPQGLTKSRRHEKISSAYDGLWEIRDILAKTPIQDQSYFLELKNTDTKAVTTLWDFAVMNWTQYLLSSAGQDGINEEKPRAITFIAENYQGKFDPDAPRAVKAASIFEYSPPSGKKLRNFSSELWRIKRLMLPFQYPGAVSAFKDGHSAVISVSAVLKNLMDAFKSPAAAQAGLEAAKLLNQRGEYKAAVEICRETEAGFSGLPANTVVEGYAAKECSRLRTGIELPRLELTAHTCPPSGKKAFNVKARNLQKIYFRLYKTSPEELESLAEPYERKSWDFLRRADQKTIEAVMKRNPDYSFEAEIAYSAPHQYAEKTLDMPPVKPGLYIAAASGDDEFVQGSSLMNASMLNATELFLIASAGLAGSEGEFPAFNYTANVNSAHKAGRKTEAFRLYAVNALTGLPAKDARIDGFKRKNWGEPEKISRYTGADGRSAETAEVSLIYPSHENYSLDPLALLKDSYAYLQYPSAFNFSVQPPIKLFIETDRPIYRPGHEMRVKITAVIKTAGLVRQSSSGGEYRVYAESAVTAVVSDPNGGEIFRKELRTGKMGSASFKFTIPDKGLLGQYNISASLPGFSNNFTGYGSVRVEEYKRPEFEITIKKDTASLHYGKPAKIEGKALYYFGSPVPSAAVSYKIYRETYIPWFYWWMKRRIDSGMKETASGETKTDEKGVFSFQFTPLPGENENINSLSRFRVEIMCRDAGGRTISADETFTAGNNAFLFDISLPANFAREDLPYDISARLLNLNETPVSGKGKYEVCLLEKSSADVQADAYSLEQAFADNTCGKRLRSGELLFSADKPAKAVLTGLKKGVYRLTVSADAVAASKPSNAVVEGDSQSVVILAAGANGAVPEETPEVTLPEKQSYFEGETAKILLGPAKPLGNIYIEIWAGEFLLSKQTLSPGRKLIEIPVTADHKGGFTAQWFCAGDFQIKSGAAFIAVPWKEKRLSLSLKYDKKLLPGQKARWSLSAKDCSGKPVNAEGLVRIFDRSLEYYSQDDVFWGDSLYPPRHTGARPLFSGISFSSTQIPVKTGLLRRLLEILRSPSAGRLEMPSLRISRPVYFDSMERGTYGGRGMRLMAAGIETTKSALGSASFSGRAKGPQAEDMAVMTTALSAAPAPQAVNNPAEKKDMAIAPPRSDFSETAFFQPHLNILNGKGGFSFKIPERLTSWKITANAVTADLKTGAIAEEAVTKKDLMVRLEMPRFMREGDTGEIKAIVHNETDSELSGAVEISAEGTDGLPQAPLLPENLPRSFKLGPHSVFTASWKTQAPHKTGNFSIQVSAKAGNLADAEKKDLPVLPSRQRLIETKTAHMNGAGIFSLELEGLKNKDPLRTNESVHLQIDPQIALSVLNALPFVVHYPYECAEQLASRYVPLAIVNSFYKKYPGLSEAVKKLPKRNTITPSWNRNDTLGLTTLIETPWEEISKGGAAYSSAIDMFDPALVEKEKKDSLEKLKNYQLPDGSFPWFPGGKPDMYITLYLLESFAEALRYNAEIPVDSTKKALSYVSGQVPGYVKNNRNTGPFGLYAAYVLTSFPKTWPETKQAFAYAKKLADESTGRFHDSQSREDGADEANAAPLKTTHLGNVYLACIYHRLGDEKKSSAYLDKVMDGARIDPVTGLYWTPEKISWLWYSDSVEKHAFILKALLEIRPNDKRIPAVAQWLLFNKKGNEWKSTKASAKAIYSLLDLIKSQGAMDKEAKFEIKWGGAVKKELIAPFDWLSKPLIWTIPGAEVSALHSKAEINKSGPGTAFASLSCIYSTDKLPSASGEGILRLERKFFLRYKEGDSYRLRPLSSGDTVGIGDEIEARLTIRAKSRLEYVHIKDPRGAGFEPEELTSGWKWDSSEGQSCAKSQGSLSRYEEIRDSLANFFIDRLPHGEYALTYKIRPASAGTYRIGAAVIQSMYAPEISANSDGIILNVQDGR